MSVFTIDETCRCGGRLWAVGHSTDVKNRQANFHEHRKGCRVPEPGMCGQPSSPLVRDGERTTMFCQLRAGHAGFHEDGQGCSWGHPRWTVPAGNPSAAGCTCGVDPLDRMPPIDGRCPVHSPTPTNPTHPSDTDESETSK